MKLMTLHHRYFCEDNTAAPFEFAESCSFTWANKEHIVSSISILHHSSLNFSSYFGILTCCTLIRSSSGPIDAVWCVPVFLCRTPSYMAHIHLDNLTSIKKRLILNHFKNRYKLYIKLNIYIKYYFKYLFWYFLSRFLMLSKFSGF